MTDPEQIDSYNKRQATIKTLREVYCYRLDHATECAAPSPPVVLSRTPREPWAVASTKASCTSWPSLTYSSGFLDISSIKIGVW